MTGRCLAARYQEVIEAATPEAPLWISDIIHGFFKPNLETQIVSGQPVQRSELETTRR
jgi:hypothetical protein